MSAGTTVFADAQDPLLAADVSLVDLVEAVRALPYGRPSDRSVDGLLRERRGTCSTKHLFLARALRERFPHTQPQIMHRVYRAEREQIRERYGDEVAATVPKDGLVDVHQYLLIRVGGRQITLDVTFPDGEPWDGRSSLPLACGSGEDVAAGDNPTRTSERLKHATVTPLCETHSSRHSQPLLRRAAADRHQAVRRDHRYHRGLPITHRRRGRQIRTKFRKAAAQM